MYVCVKFDFSVVQCSIYKSRAFYIYCRTETTNKEATFSSLQACFDLWGGVEYTFLYSFSLGQPSAKQYFSVYAYTIFITFRRAIILLFRLVRSYKIFLYNSQFHSPTSFLKCCWNCFLETTDVERGELEMKQFSSGKNSIMELIGQVHKKELWDTQWRHLPCSEASSTV